MTTTDATGSPPRAAHAAPDYRVYLKVWAVLLLITLVMVFTQNPLILLPGMAAKAALIALWFMHLKDERGDFVFYVAASILVFSLVLFGLIAPDGRAM